MVDNGKLIDDQAFHALQHPLQRRRFVLALIFALLLFPLIAICLIFGTIVLIVPLGGVLLSHSRSNDSSPIHRGKVVAVFRRRGVKD